MANEEKTFFQLNDVWVTNARFLVKGQTYAMSGITSVKYFREEPSRTGPVTLIILGGVVALGIPDGGRFLGLFLLALGVYHWQTQKPDHGVLLTTASGEVKALSSEDSGYISQVIAALNQSIVFRG